MRVSAVAVAVALAAAGARDEACCLGIVVVGL